MNWKQRYNRLKKVLGGRYYYVYYQDPCDGGVIVKARNIREAKRKGYKLLDLGVGDYIYVKVRWLKEVDPEFLEKFNKGDYYEPPFCEHCGRFFLTEEEAKKRFCPVCENGKHDVC